MSKYYGGAKATKAYPNNLPTKSMSLELDKDATIQMMASLSKFLADKGADDKRIIITAYKGNTTKKDNKVPMTFIVGKSKENN